MSINKFELYKKAVGKWGYQLQEDVLIEECSELIKACIKRRRTGKTKELLEELMDVEIMVDQIKFYYDSACGQLTEMENIKNQKLTRLKQRIEQ